MTMLVRRLRTLALAILAASVLAPDARAQEPVPDPVAVEAPDSPRAALRQFLELTAQGSFDRAGNLLGARGGEVTRTALAERLHEVIRRRVSIALDSVSPLPHGDPADGEPPLQDRAGRLLERGRPGPVQPIVLQRVSDGGQERWVIAELTFTELGDAWSVSDASWATEQLPAELLVPGPFGVPRWKWAVGVLGPVVAWMLTIAIGFLLRTALLTVARRTRVTWDEELVHRLHGPARLFLASVLLAPIAPLLELDANVIELVWRVLRGVTVVALFWAMLRLIGLGQDHIARQAWLADHATGRTIVPLVGRSLRVVLALVALLVTFAEFGYPVGTVLAGLGIGGLVVALAAQKTVENVFGSVSLAADRVFRVGDWVSIDGSQGSVERIGLRSTHIRTAERTLVKFPNGRLADMRVESFGERDRIRLFAVLTLVHDATPTQLRAVLHDAEELLRAHPRVWPDGVSVRLAAVGRHGLDVNVNAWFSTTDGAEFERIRQELLLGILEIVERSGTRLVSPIAAARVP